MALAILKSLFGTQLGISKDGHISMPGGTISPETGTVSATAGAATLNRSSGKVTSESLSTAAGATYTLTLTNSKIVAGDLVMASVALGSSTTGSPVITTVKAGAGSVVIIVQNVHASAALNGTIVISYLVVKA